MDKVYTEVLEQTAQNMQQNIASINAANDLMISYGVKDFDSIPHLRDSYSVKTFLDDKMTGDASVKMKKVFLAGMLVARNRGIVVIPEKYNNPVSIAVSVNDALDWVKGSYKIGSGTLTVEDWIDHKIDVVAAKTKVVLGNVVEIGTKVALNKACDCVERVFPPSRVVTPIVRTAIPFVAKTVGNVVKKGVSLVATAAKVVVKGVVTAAKKVGNFLKSLLPWNW